MVAKLTYRQRWQLAIRLLFLYSPLTLYINLPESVRSLGKVVELLPFIAAIFLIALGLYFIWISATDWIQNQLFQRFGEEFLLDFNWRALILTMLISLGLAVLYALVFQLIITGLFKLIFYVGLIPQHSEKSQPFTPEVFAYLHRVNNVFNLVIMLSAFYLTLISRSYQQLKDVQLRAERSEKEAALSQVEALKHQLSPHFLFNSLSILTSMVHEDADLSEKFIKQLSKVYRYILEQRDQELVALKTEIEFIRAYTFLLQIRFENKFDVLIEITPAEEEQYKIAPLSLQLLVENAVKHNRMSITEPLQVRIYCKGDVLVVENPWLPRNQPDFSTGIGLKNIINRYALLTPRPVSHGRQDQSFVVEIPLLS
ncbi:sensor histidine kinase [Spirosoma foliorum]|uniref:Histidine kinase n=1 Tax=Spirosoma foliorum TaxID=2710596 RepID=A0A7G5H631_9BACT|nr:histidine kinase [Spirosoma foliorum]QMW06573.1 histidine kinase [Spirosoma foliorum]